MVLNKTLFKLCIIHGMFQIMVGVLKIVTVMSEFEKGLIFKVNLAADLNCFKIFIRFIYLTVNFNLNSSTTTIVNTKFSLISLGQCFTIGKTTFSFLLIRIW